jgi:hypothetical protein
LAAAFTAALKSSLEASPPNFEKEVAGKKKNGVYE